MGVSEFFRLSEKREDVIREGVVNAVSGWLEVAMKYGKSRGEQELKAMAFMSIKS